MTDRRTAVLGLMLGAFVALAPSRAFGQRALLSTAGPGLPSTTDLIDRLRHDVIPSTGLPILVGGNTAPAYARRL